MLSVLELFGGVGLFLYGMNMMGASLEKLAGGGLEKILHGFLRLKITSILFATEILGVLILIIAVRAHNVLLKSDKEELGLGGRIEKFFCHNVMVC